MRHKKKTYITSQLRECDGRPCVTYFWDMEYYQAPRVAHRTEMFAEAVGILGPANAALDIILLMMNRSTRESGFGVEWMRMGRGSMSCIVVVWALRKYVVYDWSAGRFSAPSNWVLVVE